MKIFFYEQTHQGCRENNQDYYAHVLTEHWACFVLTDGLGGHERGEVAAQEFCRAIQNLAEKFAQKIMQDPLIAMEELIMAASDRMRHNIQQQYGMIDTQTTFALVWLDVNQVITAHIGDSRIYRLAQQGLLWRTLDHSYAQELFAKGKITEEEFSSHPSQHRLLKTLNLRELPSADIFVHPALAPDQLLVLCSDGFWAPLKEKEFTDIVQSVDIPHKIQELIQKILNQRPHDADNITVQVIKILSP